MSGESAQTRAAVRARDETAIATRPNGPLKRSRGLLRRLLRLILWCALILTAALALLYIRLALYEGRPADPHPYFMNESARLQVIAHRGGAGLRPENTLTAFAHALDIGVDIIEMDVRSSADGELVLMHDRTVDRTTDGAGLVSTLTLAELKRLDAAYRFTTDGGRTFPFRGRGVIIPTLIEVLDEFPTVRLIVEPKDTTAGTGEQLCRVLRERGATARVLVGAFRQSTLEEFRSACPEVATSASTSEALGFLTMQRTGVAEAFSPNMKALQVPPQFFGLDVPTSTFINAARSRNLEVHVWTINDPEEMRRLIEAGVDGIMTDYPDRLIEMMKEEGGRITERMKDD